MSNKKEIVLHYCFKYKEFGHAPLAKLIYEENKEVFGTGNIIRDVENIRGRIRKIRGKSGKYHNQRAKIKEDKRVPDRTKVDTLRKPNKLYRLFFDIETSPNICYTWRTGYNINLSPDNIINERAVICVSYKWEFEDKVRTLTWDNGCDKELLKQFIEVANDADELIAHNGDRYDIKWLRTRCLKHRLPMLSTYKTLDTLKKAKSHFLFNSNKLDYIAQFTEVGKKLETGGFQLWIDVMNGDKEALKKMVEYCEQDVLVLEDVYNAISSYISHNNNFGVLDGGTKADCPKCASENVRFLTTRTTAAGTIQRIMKCNTCDSDFKISNRTYQEWLK